MLALLLRSPSGRFTRSRRCSRCREQRMKGRRPVFAFSPPCSVWASGGIATADWMLVTVSILPWENVAPLLAWLPNRAAAYARGPDPRPRCRRPSHHDDGTARARVNHLAAMEQSVGHPRLRDDRLGWRTRLAPQRGRGGNPEKANPRKRGGAKQRGLRRLPLFAGKQERAHRLHRCAGGADMTAGLPKGRRASLCYKGSQPELGRPAAGPCSSRIRCSSGVPHGEGVGDLLWSVWLARAEGMSGNAAVPGWGPHRGRPRTRALLLSMRARGRRGAARW